MSTRRRLIGTLATRVRTAAMRAAAAMMALLMLALTAAPAAAQIQETRPPAVTGTRGRVVCDIYKSVVLGQTLTVNDARTDITGTCSGSFTGTVGEQFARGDQYDNTTDAGNDDNFSTYGSTSPITPNENGDEGGEWRSAPSTYGFRYVTNTNTSATELSARPVDTFLIKIDNNGASRYYLYYHVTVVPPAPTVTSVNPSSGGLNVAASIQIQGTNLGSATGVTVGGVTATYSVAGPTQLNVTVPASTTPGSKAVVVTNPGGPSNSDFVYRHYAAVTNAAVFSPTTIVAGASTSTLTFTLANPGTNPGSMSAVAFSTTIPSGLTLTGAQTSCGGTAAIGGGTISLTGGTIAAEASCTVTATASATPGRYEITPGAASGRGARGNADSSTESVVTGTAGTAAVLTVVPPPPEVNSITPATGPAGTSVTIVGRNLTGATAVRFAATNATSYTVDSATQITAIAPSGVTGTVDVSVTTPGGTGTRTGGYRFIPAAPAITTPANGATTGSRPTYSGTAPANSTVTVYVDNVAISPTATADGAGNWLLTQPTALAYTSHQVYATATANGATSANSATNTFTVARTATPVVTVPANNSTVATTTPTYAGTAPANGTVTVTVDGTAIGTTTANGVGNWSLTQPTALSQGSHTVYATAQAGGLDVSSNSNTNTFTVDTVAPAAPVITSPANNSTTTSRQPTISGTAEANSTVTVIIDGNSGGTTTASAGGSWTVAAPAQLSFGAHTVRATATDAAGNVSPSSATNTFTVAQAPAVTQNPSNQTVAVGQTATFSITASGSPSPTVQWQVSTDGGVNFSNVPANGNGTSYTTPATLPGDNGNAYRAVLTNSAGSTASTAATLTVVQAPTANAQAVTVATNTARAITLTGSDPNTPARTLTYAIATNPAHGTLSGFNASTGAVTYTPTSGYTGPDSFTFTVNNTVSTSAPATVSITVGSPITITPATLPDGAAETPYSQALTASGGTGPYTFAVTSGTLPAGLSLSSGGVLSGTPAEQGTYGFTVTASDASTPAQTGSQAYTLLIGARAGGGTRTWVASDGLDTNSCSRANPCATFAAAFAKVAAGGEINCVDNGAYGTLTIDKAVSIVCGDKVGRAGVIVTGSDSIVVAAGANDRVVLSGLDIEGLGNAAVTAGTYGVRFTSGGSLLIRNSTIRSTRGYAVAFEPNATASLDLHDVRITDSGASATPDSGGVLLRPSAGTARLTASRVQVTGGQQAGIRLDATVGTQVAATVVRSVVSDNAGTGVASTGTVRTAIVGSTVAGNAIGVSTGGTGSVTVIGDSTIARNATGIVTTAGGNVATTGDNTLAGNTADGAFTMSVGNQ